MTDFGMALEVVVRYLVRVQPYLVLGSRVWSRALERGRRLVPNQGEDKNTAGAP